MASYATIVPEPFPHLVFHYSNVIDWRPVWTVYMTAVVDVFPEAAVNVASQAAVHVPADEGSWGEWPS